MLFDKKQKPFFSDAILMASVILVGGFHEYISCVLAIAMSVCLLVKACKEKALYIQKDLMTMAVAVICLAYGVTCLWAVDSGMAFIGFLKFLPVLLYVICLQQEKGTGAALEALPWLGAGIALASAVGMQFSATESLFSVAGRLAGFFQYPNTFAVFLLVCQLLVVRKPGKKPEDYIVLLVLLVCLLYTGSRTAFIVAILANAGMLFAVSRKKMRIVLLGAMAAVVLVCGLLALDDQSVLRRYLSISLTESTFVGRLLYWVDALPLLIKYPFGMGYMGYYYVQQSVQTGVYSVVYAHNDFLQLLLDVGWIPGVLFAVALVKWFLKKTVSITDKIIAAAICVHSFFDFDLQFISVWLLLILILFQEKTDKVWKFKPTLMIKTGFAATVLVAAYMGAALFLAHLGFYEISDAMYPYNTNNKLTMLEQTEDLGQANALAEEILEQNTAYYLPYSMKAKYAYSRGNFGAVVENCREAIRRNPFQQREYEEYCQMLMIGIDLYQKAGDTNSVQFCKTELIAAKEQLEANAKRLSPLGSMIKDQPNMVLSQQVQEYIASIGG